MPFSVKRGVAICHYDRTDKLLDMIQATKATTPEDTKIVVCDDGTYSPEVHKICRSSEVILVSGPNLGVAHNKNRALWALQDCTIHRYPLAQW